MPLQRFKNRTQLHEHRLRHHPYMPVQDIRKLTEEELLRQASLSSSSSNSKTFLVDVAPRQSLLKVPAT
jgi:hypothetical protein